MKNELKPKQTPQPQLQEFRILIEQKRQLQRKPRIFSNPTNALDFIQHRRHSNEPPRWRTRPMLASSDNLKSCGKHNTTSIQGGNGSRIEQTRVLRSVKIHNAGSRSEKEDPQLYVLGFERGERTKGREGKRIEEPQPCSLPARNALPLDAPKRLELDTALWRGLCIEKTPTLF